MRFEFSSEREVELALRELHEPRAELVRSEQDAAAVGLSSPDSAEEAALAQWEARYAGADSHGSRSASGSGSRMGLMGLIMAHRMAVVGFALLMTIAGACVLPTSYDVPLGLSLEIRASEGMVLPAQEIAKYVQSRGQASQVDVMVREIVSDDRAQTLMQIRLWDQSLPLGELEPELRESFPSLADAQITEVALEGEIETVWARRFAHRTFDLALKEADVEEAREHLLMRLHTSGFEDDEVTVKVRDREDGHREIELRIDQHHEGSVDHEKAFEGLGPGFHWVFDPAMPEHLELPAGEDHEPMRIEIEHLVGPARDE